MIRIITSIAAVLLASLALAGAALAHAEFVKSTPAPGQTVATSPLIVTITFSEELGTGSVASVTDASGATVSNGMRISDDHLQIAIALRPSLPNGLYKVSWHTVAADDQGVLEGAFFFGVGVPVPSTATLPPANTTGLALALVLLASLVGLLSFRALRVASA